MLRNSLGHRGGGIQAPQIPKRGRWGLGFEADGCVGDSVDLWEESGSFGDVFALAQSCLSFPGAKAVAAVELTARTLG